MLQRLKSAASRLSGQAAPAIREDVSRPLTPTPSSAVRPASKAPSRAAVLTSAPSLASPSSVRVSAIGDSLDAIVGAPGAGAPISGPGDEAAYGATLYDALEGAVGGALGSAAGGLGSGDAGEMGDTGAETASDDSGANVSDDQESLVGQLLMTLESEAKNAGMTLTAYASKLLTDYPWLGPILGVTSGAALVALFTSLYKSGGTKAATTSTTRKKSKASKPKGWSKSEWAAWKKARGRSGPISKAEFHKSVWPEMRPKRRPRRSPSTPSRGRRSVRTRGGDTITYEPAKRRSKKKSKKKGKRVSFVTADGERVSFTARR